MNTSFSDIAESTVLQELFLRMKRTSRLLAFSMTCLVLVSPCANAWGEDVELSARSPSSLVPPAVAVPEVLKAEHPKSVTIQSYDEQGHSKGTKTIQQLPEWMQDPRADAPQGVIVLVSQRFSSIAEARSQLDGKLRTMLTERGLSLQSVFSRGSSSLDLLQKHGGVRQECQISWLVEVGEFTEPVYQVALQLQIDGNPHLAAAALEYRQSRNLRWLASCVTLGSLAMAFASFRMKRVWERKA